MMFRMLVDFVKVANAITETKFIAKNALGSEKDFHENSVGLNRFGLNPRSLLPLKSKRHALGR
jgi:hypothetical protein